MEPLLSVCCITYNHEKYIKDAIEGFLIQKTEFPIEILIYDDCSTDGTTEIIREYERKHPHLIRCIYQKENQKSKGRAVFPIVWNEAKAKYIATCEGDDYWTDPLKLQKQIDLLEGNPNYAGCFHETQQIYDDGRQGRIFGREAPTTLTEEDTFATQSPFHTSSFVFKNGLIDFPQWLSTVSSGDMAVFSIVSSKGPLVKIPEIMSVYRRHEKGLTSAPDFNASFHEARIKLIKHLNAYHNYKFDRKANEVICAHRQQLDIENRSKLVVKREQLAEGHERHLSSKDNLEIVTNRNDRSKPAIVSDREVPSLAILTPVVGAVSETFIQRQIELLSPGRTVVIAREVANDFQANFPILFVPFETGPAKYSPINENKVVGFLKSHDVTHILCQYGSCGGEMVELNARKFHLPILMHFHGFDASKMLRESRMVEYYQWLGQNVTGVIAVSEVMKERLVQVGIPSEKIHCIHYGVEIPTEFALHKKDGIVNLLSVMRLVPKKGPILLLESIKKAHNAVPNMRVDIIGDGPLREEVERFVRENEMSAYVRLHGAQPFKSTKDRFRQADIFVQHSITDPQTGDAEGLPNTILEASSYGLPVVSTLHEGIPEAVEHNVTGFLVQEGDVNGMAEYVVKLINDPELRKTMGLAGRKRMENDFKVERQMNSIRRVMNFQKVETMEEHSRSIEPPRSCEELLGEAETAIQSKQLYRAQVALKVILAQRPKDVAALNDLAVIKILTQDFESAAETIGAVLDKDPDNGIAKKNLKILKGLLTKELSDLKGAQEDNAASQQMARTKFQATNSGEQACDDAVLERFPLVSIVVPTYNRPEGLRETLTSISKQTYRNLEVIVVNDAGESVGHIVDEFISLLNVRYFDHETNKRSGAARNTGIKAATGEYICYIDDDDIFYPDHIETLVRKLIHDNCSVAYTDAHQANQVKQDGRFVTMSLTVPYSEDFKQEKMLVANFIPILCVMHKRSILDEVGIYDESLTSHIDWDLWVRIALNYNFVHVRKVTCRFTWRHDGSTMTSRGQEDLRRTAAIVYAKYAEHCSKIPGLVDLQRKKLTEWIGDLRIQAEKLGAEGHIGDAIKKLGRLVDVKINVMKTATHLHLDFNNENRFHIQLLLDLALKAANGRKIESSQEAYKSVLSLDKNNLQAMSGLVALGQSKDVIDIKTSSSMQKSDELSKRDPGIITSIIIPVFNQLEYTQRCLEALAENTNRTDFEIVIVDNASIDGTGEYLATLNRKIKIISNEENLGFARACNQGARLSSGKYLVFLNNDTEAQPGWLEELLKTTDEGENVGIVGSKLLYPDGTIQHAGVAIDKNKLPYHIYKGYPSDFIFANRQRDYQVVTAACMLVNRDLFFDVGCFDERYLNGYEDVDFCLKVRGRGKRVVYNPASVLIHHEGKSEGRQSRMDLNQRLLLERWANVIQQDDYLVFMNNWEELMKQGFIDEATKNFEHVLSLLPTQAEIDNRKKQFVHDLYAKAQLLIGEKKYDEAKEDLKRALEIEPLDSACLNDLAVLYSMGAEVDAAIELLNRLSVLESGNIVARKNLASLYLRTNKIEDALNAYSAVLKIAPQDVETLLAIAKICLHLQRNTDAKFFYNKVLMISKDSEFRKQILMQLKSIDSQERAEDSQKSTPSTDETAVICSDSSTNAPVFVSIVIPVFNKVEFTERCIESILSRAHHQAFEIIVVDNGSTDDTRAYLMDLSARDNRIKYIHNETNLGFVEACNVGAKSGQGKYILLLNNDTQVNENWLESLVEFAEKTPNCGAVGSKLIYPDGRLQEAGGITFSDGNGWNYGRGLDPNHPKFNFVREVDYISGASLMVRKDLWDKVAGLDLLYAPAYYEDADLCFAIRNLGYKVFYQPRSSLVHYEGVTSGTNLNEGFKKFQIINRPKFIEKWKSALIEQYANDPRNVEKASSRGIVKRIFVTDPILPMFDRAAGSLHLFNILKILRKMSFHVTFISGRQSLDDVYKPILQELGIETYAGDPDAMSHIGFAAAYKKIDYASVFKEREFDIALIDFWHHAEYYLPLVRKYSPLTIVIIDTEDIHYVRELREAEIKGNPDMKVQGLANKQREVAIYKKADRLWVVTEEDKRALMKEVAEVPIDIRPVVHDLPEIRSDFGNRQGILFVGNFNHTPNLDAVQFFISGVLPKVKEAFPEITFYIVGNDPKKEVIQIASRGVVVAGYVEDLSKYYNMCRVVVAPLRYGAGLKGKIVESLSYGVPVVTTSVGVEGTGLQDGMDIMVADDPDDMAKKIIDLYSNKEMWERLSGNGRKQMESKWSFDAGKKRLENILLDQVIEPCRVEEKLASIIILTYNQLEFTKLTIDSIRRRTKTPYEIIAVDNASSDGTVEYLKAQKDIRAIFNEENLGFPAGCNQGMEIAKGDYIVLLNNDVIVSDNWLEGLIECAESNPKVGVVGPMSNRISGHQLERSVTYRKTSQIHEFAASYRRKNRKSWFETSRIAGFCMLIKRTVLDKLGGLDVVFGIGNCEDDDFCIRTSLAGFKIVIAGDVFIHHFGSRSFGKDGLEKYKEFIRANENIFKEKWGVTPLEWWREGKSITKLSPLFVPLNVREALPVLSEGTYSNK